MQWKVKCAELGRSRSSTDCAKENEREGIDGVNKREIAWESALEALNDASKHLQGATVHKQERAQWDAKDDKQTRKRREWAASEIRLRALDATA